MVIRKPHKHTSTHLIPSGAVVQTTAIVNWQTKEDVFPPHRHAYSNCSENIWLKGLMLVSNAKVMMLQGKTLSIKAKGDLNLSGFLTTKQTESRRGGWVSMVSVWKTTSTIKGFCRAWLVNSDGAKKNLLFKALLIHFSLPLKVALANLSANDN